MRPVQGFVKLAIQHGAVIATGYCFGNTSILRVHTDPFGVLKWLSRTLRVSLVMISGRWGLPIPYRVPVAIVMGEPIITVKNANPSQEVHMNRAGCFFSLLSV